MGGLSADVDIPRFGIRLFERGNVAKNAGRLIIQFKDDAIRPFLPEGRLRFTTKNSLRLPEPIVQILEYLRNNCGLRTANPILSNRYRLIAGSKAIRPIMDRLGVLISVADPIRESLAGISVLSLDPDRVDAKLIRKLNATPSITYCEPLPQRYLFGKPATPDPMTNLQWGLRAIRWFGADIPDASNIQIAIVDSGVDESHPDLNTVIHKYHRSGLKRDDLVGHGTHVAGIIGALTNHRIGASGIANCRISVWKVFNDEPDTATGDFVADGTRYLESLGELLTAGIDIVNCSIGGHIESRTERLLFETLERNGTSVVAAIGNEYLHGNPVEYPAAYPSVIAVGAINEASKKSPFSNTGEHISVVAPGSNILSTVPTRINPYRDETYYASWSGTSMAAPHVSAVAALLRAKYPALSPAATKRALLRTAQRLPVMARSRWTASYGYGLVDLSRALRYGASALNASAD